MLIKKGGPILRVGTGLGAGKRKAWAEKQLKFKRNSLGKKSFEGKRNSDGYLRNRKTTFNCVQAKRAIKNKLLD